jgi:hypothetical protein
VAAGAGSNIPPLYGRVKRNPRAQQKTIDRRAAVSRILHDVAFYYTPCYIASMTNEDEISKLLAQAAEQLKREAYAAGWRDAVAAMNKAISDIAEQDLPSGSVTIDAPTAQFSQATSDGPTVGSTPWYVLQAVRKRPGMTGLEVINYVRDGGHKVPGGSIRVALNRLKGRRLIVPRHGKWFPA